VKKIGETLTPDGEGISRLKQTVTSRFLNSPAYHSEYVPQADPGRPAVVLAGFSLKKHRVRLFRVKKTDLPENNPEKQ
jgi:hypothetical protein